jgi:TonB family protein
MSKKNALTLRITGPDGSITESQSDLESVILGSGAGAAIKLADPKVSSLHVMLKVERSGEVTAIDLGSEHGTQVGNQIITDPTLIASGDTLVVGGSVVKVLFGEAPEVSPAPPPARQVNGHGHKNGALRSISLKEMPAARGLAGTGQNAAIMFNEPLPPEATPAEDSKVLQVALLWGDTLINLQHFAEGVPVTIGEARQNKFHVYSPGVGETFSLAVSNGATMLVNVPADAGVVVASGTSQKAKEQLRSEGRLRASDGPTRADALELGLHDRVQISLENVAFIVRYVRPSAMVSINSLQEADYTFFKIASVCIMAFLAMVAAILLTPQVDGSTSDDIFQNPSKYVKLLVKPEKKPELNIQKLSGAEEGKKAKDDEGKFGKQEEKKKEADPSKKGSPIVDANKREEDRKKVMSAGLLGAMNNSGAASNIFGPGGLGIGINNALGGLKGGAGMGDAHGVGGLGSRGAGPGGGGTGLGLGGLGTKGGGRGAGGHGIDLGGRGKDVTRIIPGRTTVVGGLDRDVIAKVVRRHMNEIKYCYEQELQKNPSLSGKVGIQWTIDPAGSVADANVSESSLSSPNAESCMLARVRRWKFPEPKGGGVVAVTYPFVFKAAGSGDDD